MSVVFIVQELREFGSSGVQEFRSSGVQEFRSSVSSEDGLGSQAIRGKSDFSLFCNS
jgi:hypothetical protein